VAGPGTRPGGGERPADQLHPAGGQVLAEVHQLQPGHRQALHALRHDPSRGRDEPVVLVPRRIDGDAALALERFGRVADFENPRTYEEKVNFRKLYGNHETYAQAADKIRVRDYVAEKRSALEEFHEGKSLEPDVVPHERRIQKSRGS